jgi:hypothetical protein
MGLREQAAADLRTILEDTAAGFGWAISVTPPDGAPVALVGFSTDIAQVIDPETGIAVTGRSASVAIAIASLTAAGLDIPKAVADESGRPWVVTFADIVGKAHTFSVLEAHPDRALGVVVCRLEAYRK